MAAVNGNASRSCILKPNNTAITAVIQQTGFAIRDWVGPFYTLGGVVAFAITLLTFLDPSGLLVKGITAMLVLATAIAWAVSLAAAHRRPPVDSPAAPDQPPPAHAVLLAVTLFFAVGLAISEAIMVGKRAPATPAVPATESRLTPAVPVPVSVPVASAPAVTVESVAANHSPQPVASASASADAAPVLVVPPSQPVASAMATAPAASAASAGPASSVAAAKVKSIKGAEDRAARAARAAIDTPRVVRSDAPSAPTGDAQRCSALIAKFSLGGTPSDADKHYLETACR